MTIDFGDSSTLSSFLTVPSSILTGALPALSGASLTNVGKDIRSMDEATSTGVSNTSSTSYQDKVTLSVSTASNTRVLVFFGFEIQNSDGSDNQRTFGRLTGSNVSFVGGNYEQSTTGGYSGFVDQRLDIGSHSGTRTYKIQWKKSSANTARIQNAYIVAVAFDV